jgi:thioesterase domain-containing protein/acyl carrier protein
VWNLYGPTETTIWSTAHRVASGNGIVPIGRPISNTIIHILDRHLQPVPVGVSGELHIGGLGLARGYLNHPDLTAEKFIANPFGDEREGRLYRTGDVARYRSDGTIECLGRTDQQVKIRGFRVELGDVEAALTQHPAVRDVAVVAREEELGEKRLVAYVVSNDGVPPRLSELRGFLQEKLPDAMVPSTFVLLEALPLTPNGKVDHRALPAPGLARADLDQEYVAPRTSIERQLASIWARMLGVESVGIHDNFFELGGHSLLAAQLIARVRHDLHMELPMRDLFEAPTIAGLAVVLEKRRSGPSLPPSVIPIQAGRSEQAIFCIHPARGTVFWYRDLARSLGPDLTVYGLQARGLDAAEEPFTTIEDMAACHIETLSAVQPAGPYALVGASFGGAVAFEMAQQLQARGLPVALLALVNTAGPDRVLQVDDAVLLAAIVGDDFQLSFDQLREARQLERDEQLLYVMERARIAGKLRQSLHHLEVRRYLHLWKTNIEAMRRYAPRVYPGRVLFFRANERGIFEVDSVSSWARVAGGGMEVHDVPGNHISVLESPHVESVTDHLRRYLVGSDWWGNQPVGA